MRPTVPPAVKVGIPRERSPARCPLSISCHVEAMVGQHSGLESTQCHIAMGVYQRVDHRRTALLPDNGIQSPSGHMLTSVSVCLMSTNASQKQCAYYARHDVLLSVRTGVWPAF